MTTQNGTLTGTQNEIMEIVWAKGREGATVAEIQEALGKDAARTTVATLVQRLEKRGWLVADTRDKAQRYRAAKPKERASGRMAAEFVDAFFGGSAAQLVQSLLGSNKIKREEIVRLRELLERKES